MAPTSSEGTSNGGVQGPQHRPPLQQADDRCLPRPVGRLVPPGREADRLGRRARRDGDRRVLGHGDRAVRLLPDRARPPPGGDGPARLHGRRRHRLGHPAQGRGLGRHREVLPLHRRDPRRRRRRVRRAPAPDVPRREDRRVHRRQGALHRGLEPLHQERRQARADHEGGLRPEDGPPPPRRQPHRDPRRHRPHLPGDRPRVRRLLPRHRPHHLRRRRPDGAVPQVPRAHLLRAHQGDGPGAGAAGPRRGLAVRQGRPRRRLGRPARRPARHARPHRGARRPRQGALRGLRAGHVRLRQGRPPAHRRPDPRVPRLARSRPRSERARQ